jgi:hypothetical protein
MSMSMDGTDMILVDVKEKKKKVKPTERHKRWTIFYGFWIGVSPNGSCGI